MKNKIIIILISTILISGCVSKNIEQSPGIIKDVLEPITEQVALDGYNNVFYVDSETSALTETGSKSEPFKSISKAVDLIPSDGKTKTAVLVSSGIYLEYNISLKPDVALLGGFDSRSWERDISKYPTLIDGEGKGRIISAANNCLIDGFTFQGGKIEGKGGAILADGVFIKISNNYFTKNGTLTPANWKPDYWHETANDGGAIYLGNGAKGIIRNNVIALNYTENGRGAGLAADNKCDLEIKTNVFLNNRSGLKDPMRSSDGGAISIFGWSNAVIDGNIILSNRSDSHNDAGGIFIALWSSAKVNNNIFVDNVAGDDAGALFVGGQEHRYDAALDEIPPKEQFFVSIENNGFFGNKNSSMNSGAMRFTMESRGEFINNIVAQNNGIYFQRSEVRVAGNTILDNFLFIETKEGLEYGIIENNILWADFDRQVEAEVKNNNMLYLEQGKNNYSKTPEFVDDGITIYSLASNWLRSENTTNLTIAGGMFHKNQIVNRVLKVGNKWTVVKSNEGSLIKIWGNFAGEESFYLLPTYKLK